MKIVNINGRREHAVALLIVGFASGSVGLVTGGTVTPPVLASLGTFWPVVFFASTLVSSCIALAGIFVRWDGVKGLLVEMGGLLLQAAAWIGYGLAVLAKAPGTGFIFALVTCGFSTAHIVRAVRIPAEARKLAAEAAALGLIDELGAP